MSICDGKNPTRRPTAEESIREDARKKAEKKALRARIKKEEEKAAGVTPTTATGRTPIPPAKRFSIMAKQHWCCFYCGAPFGKVNPETGKISTVHIDHKRSVIDGGESIDKNLVAACQDCNLGKGRKSVRT